MEERINCYTFSDIHTNNLIVTQRVLVSAIQVLCIFRTPQITFSRVLMHCIKTE